MTTQPLSQAELLVEIEIAAPRERVWQAFTGETAAWWHPSFNTRSEGVLFTIEPALGGRMFEDWGDGTDKAWGGPSRGIMNWRFEDAGEGTKVRLEHCLFGNVSEQTRTSLEEGWTFLIRDAFKVFVETGRGPDADAAAPECSAS